MWSGAQLAMSGVNNQQHGIHSVHAPWCAVVIQWRLHYETCTPYVLLYDVLVS